MQIIQSLEATRDETLGYFGLGEADLDRTYGEGKWSARFVLHHLCDAETVMFDRIRRVLSEKRGVLWAFDADDWARGLDYGARPLELSRRIYEATRAGIIHYARANYESKGHLEFVHSETGVRTLKDEIDKVVWHNEKHLGHIKLALGKPVDEGDGLKADR
jgi:hypothetical protein